MQALWTFLTAPENREVLSLLGGGVAVACGGLWTVVTFFAGKGDGDGGKAGAGTNFRITTGIGGWQLVAIALALAGVAVFAIAQAGSRVTATNGSSAIGGIVENSEINIGQ